MENMSKFYTAILLLCAVVLSIHGGYGPPKPKTCTRSSDCRLSGLLPLVSIQCCRDSTGKLVDGVEGWNNLRLLTGTNGTCSWKKSRRGEVCNDVCGCQPGYTCYRTVTGACCPPKTCWNATLAAADKLFWSTCGTPKNPNCQFPPMAPPSGGFGGLQ